MAGTKKKADTAALLEAIAAAEALDYDAIILNMVTASYIVTALAAAKALDLDNATQEEVDTATLTVSTVVEALIPKPDEIVIETDKKIHGAIRANIVQRLKYVEANLGVKFRLVTKDDSDE